MLRSTEQVSQDSVSGVLFAKGKKEEEYLGRNGSKRLPDAGLSACLICNGFRFTQRHVDGLFDQHEFRKFLPQNS